MQMDWLSFSSVPIQIICDFKVRNQNLYGLGFLGCKCRVTPKIVLLPTEEETCLVHTISQFSILVESLNVDYLLVLFAIYLVHWSVALSTSFMHLIELGVLRDKFINNL